MIDRIKCHKKMAELMKKHKGEVETKGAMAEAARRIVSLSKKQAALLIVMVVGAAILLPVHLYVVLGLKVDWSLNQHISICGLWLVYFIIFGKKIADLNEEIKDQMALSYMLWDVLKKENEL